ncbi:MAG: AmmeMemoRadiSam system protein B [Candidatus Krumholzibacteriota bacterium]|nr:AmmeMemoRadiSam system protein B [Candidatus Krumholzibacteriota bacterium]
MLDLSVSERDAGSRFSIMEDLASYSKKGRTVLFIAVLLVFQQVRVLGADPVRVPVDSVGYATTSGQMDEVVRLSMERIDEGGGAIDLPRGKMLGGILPHDDYIYAGPACLKLTREIDAPLAVIVGVSHRARRLGIRGKIVFESYRAWKGPYGEIPVSSIRESLIESLPGEIVMVNDDLHRDEHSIEGILPFLQYSCRRGSGDEKEIKGRKLEILPLLVTFFEEENFDAAAEEFSAALGREFEKKGMKIGRDYIILISSDCVHYGDEEWGGRNHAPFGTGKDGYEKAVARDIDIVKTTLAGKLTPEKIKIFRERIDSFEFEWPYKIPWCGVYSIPFGLSLISRLSAMEGRDAPVGVMLDYSTSLDPGPLLFEGEGTGATNIANLNHWVGYTSVGYW